MTNPGATMESSPLAYPGTAALRGEMLDLEVAMASARLRMAFLSTAADALGAFHTALHHEGEVEIRREQVSVIERLAAASRARVESGRAPQAELSEAQAELAMSRSDLEHALSALDAARRKFNALLDRAADAPFTGRAHDEPPATTPDAAALVDVAKRWSPEIAMARADAARMAVAERMAGRMANPTRAPGAAAMTGEAMDAAPDFVPPAWAAEISSRRAAADRAAEETERSVERMIADMAYELAAMARMYRVAKTAAEPAARQALAERMSLYENGRGEFTDLLAAAKRHLDARHDLVTALHDYRGMEARLWMAVGARPELAKGTSR
jgi:outer membrane protein TolC